LNSNGPKSPIPKDARYETISIPNCLPERREFMQKLRNKVALLDWDGTIREGFTILDWVRFLAGKGLLASGIENELNTEFTAYKNNQISHDQLASRSAGLLAGGLRGVRCKFVDRAARDFFAADRTRLHTWALEILTLLRRYMDVVVVSGAPQEVLNCYGKMCQFAQVHGLLLETINGIYSGLVKQNPGTSNGKRDVIASFINGKTVVIAIGNSDSDMPLFDASKMNIVVNNPSMKLGPSGLHLASKTDVSVILKQMDELLEKSECAR
jgi:phosphoserine phosphatase